MPQPIHLLNTYLSSAWYVPGPVLGDGDIVEDRTRLLFSWCLHSKEQKQTIK